MDGWMEEAGGGFTYPRKRSLCRDFVLVSKEVKRGRSRHDESDLPLQLITRVSVGGISKKSASRRFRKGLSGLGEL